MTRFLFVLKICLREKIFLNGGRGDRFEFFVFNIFAFALFFVLWLPVNSLLTSALVSVDGSDSITQTIHIIFRVLTFILFIAQYTSTLRRLHDTDRSGHHLLPIMAGLLITLGGVIIMNEMIVRAGEVIAGLGLLYVLVLCCLPGSKGSNRFGPPSPSTPSK